MLNRTIGASIAIVKVPVMSGDCDSNQLRNSRGLQDEKNAKIERSPNGVTLKKPEGWSTESPIKVLNLGRPVPKTDKIAVLRETGRHTATRVALLPFENAQDRRSSDGLKISEITVMTAVSNSHCAIPNSVSCILPPFAAILMRSWATC